MRRPQAKTKPRPLPRPIPEILTEMFSSEFLRRTAAETRFIERNRIIDPALFFWVLVLDFGVNFMRKLRALKRGYENAAGVELSISSFVERFTPELEAFLHRCVLHAIEFQGQRVNRRLGAKLNWISDILIQDSTIIRLHESLSKLWPAARARKGAAGVKLSTLVSVVGDGPKRLTIVPESTAEVKTLKLGSWVKDTVLLLDLGFFKLGLFDRIDAYKGFFVSRMKNKVNATIVGKNMTWRGNAKELIGMNVWEVLKSLKRGVLDVEAEFVFKRRKYKGKTTKVTRRFRLVGVYNLDEKKYHLYLTNIPPSVLSPELVALLYGARWEVELIFKELKSHFRMDQITTRKPQTIKCLIWVAILAMMCSRRLLDEIRSTDTENAHRYTHARSTMIFMERAHRILDDVLEHLEIRPGDDEMERMLFWDHTLDPNLKRKRLMDPWLE